MADSPYIHSDTGSTGSGSSKDSPIVVSNAQGYSVTIKNPQNENFVLWFKLTLFAGNWEATRIGGGFFLAIYERNGEVVRRGEPSDTLTFAIPQDGVYYLAMANSYASAAQFFNVNKPSGGYIYDSSELQITGEQAQFHSNPQINDFNKSKIWPQILWAPPPLPNAIINNPIQFGSIQAWWRLVSGELSRVTDDDQFGGVWLEDDEGELDPDIPESYNKRWPDTANAFFSTKKNKTAVIEIEFGMFGVSGGFFGVFGFGVRRDFIDPYTATDFASLSRVMKVELIDGAGNAIAWVQGGFGVAAGIGISGAVFNQPKIDSDNENEYPQEYDPYFALGYRALAIVILPTGEVMAGAHHPALITEKSGEYSVGEYTGQGSYNGNTAYVHKGYRSVGHVPPEKIVAGVRITVNKYIGLQYVDIRSPNKTAAEINEGEWWRSKNFTAEDEFDLEKSLRQPDWVYVEV